MSEKETGTAEDFIIAFIIRINVFDYEFLVLAFIHHFAISSF